MHIDILPRELQIEKIKDYFTKIRIENVLRYWQLLNVDMSNSRLSFFLLQESVRNKSEISVPFYQQFSLKV